MCGHPELNMGMTWDATLNQLVPTPKPPPTRMVGRCEHNMGCPICGFGYGAMPDPCDTASGYVVTRLGADTGHVHCNGDGDGLCCSRHMDGNPTGFIHTRRSANSDTTDRTTADARSAEVQK